MKNGVGAAAAVLRITTDEAEAVSDVESVCCFVLFVDVDGAASQRAESVGQQACAEVVSAPSGLYEEHFDVASVDAQECEDLSAGGVRDGMGGNCSLLPDTVEVTLAEIASYDSLII